MTNSWLDASLFVGGFSNLKVQVTSNTQTTITADSIVLKSSDRAYVASNVSLTNTITTSGANGLDTGSEASSTWYNVWIIYDGTTLASILSLSATAPTLTGNYTYKARVGAIRNDGSSNLYWTLQYGKNAQYLIGTNPTSIIRMGNGITANDSTPLATLALANFIPSTSSRVRGYVFASNSRSGAAPNADYSAYSSSTNAPPVTAYASGAGISVSSNYDFVVEGSDIYWFSNGSNNFIAVLGWEDNL